MTEEVVETQVEKEEDIIEKKEVKEVSELEKKIYGYECEDMIDLSLLREKISKERSIFYEILKQVGFTKEIFRISVPSILIHPVNNSLKLDFNFGKVFFNCSTL
jgi:CRISPR/Cas system-associated endonuclease Cas3-HD